MNEILLLAAGTDSISVPWYIAVIGPVASAVAGFFVGLWKNHAEVSKLKSESVKNAGEFLEQVQEKQARFNDRCEECKKFANALGDAFATATPAELDVHREALCSFVFHKVVPAYLDDLAYKQLHCHHMHNGDPDMLMLVINDAADDLKRFSSWRKIINTSALLAKLNDKSPAMFTERTFRPIDHILAKLPLSMRNEASRMIKPLVHELTQ